MLSMWLLLRVYAYAYLVQEYGNTRRRSECDHEIRQILIPVLKITYNIYQEFGGHTHPLSFCCSGANSKVCLIISHSQKVLKNTVRGVRFLLGFIIYLILAQMDQVYLILAVAL